MRAIIIDDEPANVENLEVLLFKYCPQVAIIGTANNNNDAADLINLHKPDLLFIDIQLKNDSGFNLLKLITEKTFEVIFVTAYDSYGIQAIKFAALDYLLKPVDIDELIAAVKKAENKKQEKQNIQLDFLLNHIKKDEKQPIKIALPQQKEIRYVALCDIIRCEAENTYTFFYLNNGERIIISKSLKEYTELLEPNGFLRSHQSHLVNIRYVKSWLKEDGGILLLNNGDKIPVSRPNREKFQNALIGISI